MVLYDSPINLMVYVFFPVIFFEPEKEFKKVLFSVVRKYIFFNFLTFEQFFMKPDFFSTFSDDLASNLMLQLVILLKIFCQLFRIFVVLVPVGIYFATWPISSLIDCSSAPVKS